MLAMDTAFDPIASLPMTTLDNPPSDLNPLISGGEADQHPEFDADTFSRHNEPLPPRNPLKRAFSSYEEPFSDIMSNADQGSLVDAANFENHPAIERDHKLLHFSAPNHNYALLDYTYRRVPVALSAQLHGMFFLAEPLWSGTGELISAPAELTCYRRNLFSITGSITLPRSLRYILTDQSEQIPIVAQELELSATESGEGNPVKIISVPFKTPPGMTNQPEEKAEREPPTIGLDLTTGSEVDPEFATVPISWKRLQFRIATANNGRRRELQQHFNVKIRVIATLSTGQRTPICEVVSGSIIVRGRSPRNFQAKKEVPVGSGSISNRRPYVQRSPPGEGGAAVPGGNATSAPGPASVKAEPSMQFDTTALFSPDFLDWKNTNPPQTTMTAMPADPFNIPASAGMYPQSSPDLSRKPSMKRHIPAPINLSLAEDEPRKGGPSSSETPPAKRPRMKSAVRTPSFILKDLNGNEEPADILYEYFPLGLDDWQEPVDAVYRPHVVHHINVPDVKSKTQANRSKRYFASKESSP